MDIRAPLLALWFGGCASSEVHSPEAAPIEVEISLAPPWVLVSRDAQEIAIRHADTPHGVRVWIRATEGRWAGVSPVHAGRTLEVQEDALRWPHVTFARPELGPRRVAIVAEGLDLVVRASGPPLREVSAHPAAPDDPVITWVRLRPRPHDWRIAITGLAEISFPAAGLDVGSEGAGRFVVTSASGSVVGETDAPRLRTRASSYRWSLDTAPALEAIAPYPRTAYTWTPLEP